MRKANKNGEVIVLTRADIEAWRARGNIEIVVAYDNWRAKAIREHGSVRSAVFGGKGMRIPTAKDNHDSPAVN